MRKVILFIAMSLDGYIADENGKVDWLNGQDQDVENMDSYSVFIKDVDTVIMGWKTYQQIVTELSPKEWVYADLMSYVVTHRALPSKEKIQFTKENPCDLVKRLKAEKGKDIWICGGASIVKQLMEENLIDQYDISIIPTILGKGVSLFGELEKEEQLSLLETKSCNGIVELIYERRKNKLPRSSSCTNL